MLLQVPLDWREEHKNGSVFNAPTLRRLAILAGLDLASFARCFQSGRHAVEVNRISKLARQMRVFATPSFIVGRSDMSHRYDERYKNHKGGAVQVELC
jgi:predicted DsbA family dithiol-disulfide isomerase